MLTGNSRQKNRYLAGLWQEVNSNLEHFYVIDQRGFVSAGFGLKAWEEALNCSGVEFGGDILGYAAVLEEFNRVFADMKQFECFYSSSMEHKTRANAEVLHSKKEALDEMARGLQPLILGAREQLRTMPGCC